VFAITRRRPRPCGASLVRRPAIRLFCLVSNKVRQRRLRNFTGKLEPAQPKWFFRIIIMTPTQEAE
jgi:hypothetical protein